MVHAFAMGVAGGSAYGIGHGSSNAYHTLTLPVRACAEGGAWVAHETGAERRGTLYIELRQGSAATAQQRCCVIATQQWGPE